MHWHLAYRQKLRPKDVTLRKLISTALFSALLYRCIGRSQVRHKSYFGQVPESEFVTGERISELCDVAFYSHGYLLSYPSVAKHTKSIVKVGTRLSENAHERRLVETSRVFFTKLDWIDYFVEEVIDRIHGDFVLFTHNSDMRAGSNQAVLEHPRLRRWFGCNMAPNVKTQGIPLGLENPDLWKRTDTQHLANNQMRFKDRLVYIYFNTKTNPKVRNRVARELEANGFRQSHPTQWREYIRQLARHKFCVSPEGNGIDTHRMWECIYLGVVPIVVRTPELEHWFCNLPILWVDNFTQINQDALLAVDVNSLKHHPCRSQHTAHTMTDIKQLMWKEFHLD